MALSDAEKEQTKLTATFLNTLGTGSIITAGVAPVVGYLFGFQGLSVVPLWKLVISTLIWLSAGIALHLIGRRVLRRLT